MCWCIVLNVLQVKNKCKIFYICLYSSHVRELSALCTSRFLRHWSFCQEKWFRHDSVTRAINHVQTQMAVVMLSLLRNEQELNHDKVFSSQQLKLRWHIYTKPVSRENFTEHLYLPPNLEILRTSQGSCSMWFIQIKLNPYIYIKWAQCVIKIPHVVE